jgi:hypothetical protein
MSLDVSHAPDLTVAGFTARKPLDRHPPQGKAYEVVAPLTGGRLALWLFESNGPGMAERFERAVVQLRHVQREGLPRVRASGLALEGLYLVTDLHEGPTLEDLLREHGRLAPLRAVRLLGSVADALDAAHAKGLLHRRVSARAVVVEDGPVERAVLLDAALGTAASEVPPDRRPAPELSPEEGRGEPASPLSDVYSFACVVYHAITGRPASPGETPSAPHDGQPREQPARPSVLRPELSESLDEALRRGMAKRPGDRPASAGALMSAVSRALREATPPSRASKPDRPARSAQAESAAKPWPAPPVERKRAPARKPWPAPAPPPKRPPRRRPPLMPGPQAEGLAPEPPAWLRQPPPAPPPRARLRERRLGQAIATMPLVLAIVLLGAAGVAGYLVGAPDEGSGPSRPAVSPAPARPDAAEVYAVRLRRTAATLNRRRAAGRVGLRQARTPRA